jgi:hypothetical protein
MLRREATNTNFIVFGLTRPGLEPTIYRTRGKHANHYTTDAVKSTGYEVPIDVAIYYILLFYYFVKNCLWYVIGDEKENIILLQVVK